MGRGNWLGVRGLIFLAAATACQFFLGGHAVIAGSILQWIAIVLFLLAAWYRPRMWLVLPVALVCGMLYLVFFVQ